MRDHLPTACRFYPSRGSLDSARALPCGAACGIRHPCLIWSLGPLGQRTHGRGPEADPFASSRMSLIIATRSGIDARLYPVTFPSISRAPRRASSPLAWLLRDERFDHLRSTVVGQRARGRRIGLRHAIFMLSYGRIHRARAARSARNSRWMGRHSRQLHGPQVAVHRPSPRITK